MYPFLRFLITRAIDRLNRLGMPFPTLPEMIQKALEKWGLDFYALTRFINQDKLQEIQSGERYHSDQMASRTVATAKGFIKKEITLKPISNGLYKQHGSSLKTLREFVTGTLLATPELIEGRDYSTLDMIDTAMERQGLYLHRSNAIKASEFLRSGDFLSVLDNWVWSTLFAESTPSHEKVELEGRIRRSFLVNKKKTAGNSEKQPEFNTKSLVMDRVMAADHRSDQLRQFRRLPAVALSVTKRVLC